MPDIRFAMFPGNLRNDSFINLMLFITRPSGSTPKNVSNPSTAEKKAVPRALIALANPSPNIFLRPEAILQKSN